MVTNALYRFGFSLLVTSLYALYNVLVLNTRRFYLTDLVELVLHSTLLIRALVVGDVLVWQALLFLGQRDQTSGCLAATIATTAMGDRQAVINPPQGGGQTIVDMLIGRVAWKMISTWRISEYHSHHSLAGSCWDLDQNVISTALGKGYFTIEGEA